MNRDAADILVPDFDFASMEARARWQSKGMLINPRPA
jgi:hypothetical protein